MTPPPTVQDRLRRAFEPTRHGVAGLVEQMLVACAGADLAFERVGDRCVCRWSVGGDTHEVTVPLRPAAFRTVLARIATLCNERDPGSVTPYRGEGLLPIPGNPTALLRVHYVNTPENQQLELKGVIRTATEVAEDKPLVELSHAEVVAPSQGRKDPDPA